MGARGRDPPLRRGAAAMSTTTVRPVATESGARDGDPRAGRHRGAPDAAQPGALGLPGADDLGDVDRAARAGRVAGLVVRGDHARRRAVPLRHLGRRLAALPPRTPRRRAGRTGLGGPPGARPAAGGAAVRGGRCGVRRPGRLARAGPRRPVDRHGARPHDRGPPHHGRAGAARRPRAGGRRARRRPRAADVAARGPGPRALRAVVRRQRLLALRPGGRDAVLGDPGPAGQHHGGPGLRRSAVLPVRLAPRRPPAHERGLAAAVGRPRRSRGGTTCGCSGSPRCCSASRGPGRDVGHCSPSGRSSPWQASSASTW